MSRGPALTQADVNNVVALKAMDPMLPDTTIGRMIGRSDGTVRKLAERFEGLIQEYRGFKSRDIIDDLDCIRRAHLLNLAEPEKIDACSAAQSAVVYGILTEKLLLESGRPTSINLTATVDATMPDLLSRLKRAIEGRGATRSSDGQAECVNTTSSLREENSVKLGS